MQERRHVVRRSLAVGMRVAHGMGVRASTSLFWLPETRGVAVVLRLHDAELRRAARHFITTGDGDALHGVRVAMRKLRGALGAYATVLPTLRVRKVRRRLARLMRQTSNAREADVALTMLQAHGGLPSATLEARWRADVHEELERARQRVASRLPRVLRKLRGIERAADAAPRPRFHRRFITCLRSALHTEVRRFADAATRLGTYPDADALHHVRISAKRLRYLLAPIASQVQGAGRLTEQLAQLQAQLGLLRDRAAFAWQLDVALGTRTP